MERHEYTAMYENESRLWWYRGLHELIAALARRRRERLGRELRIFDAGCGTGRTAEVLAACGTVDGIDYSPHAVAYCRERGLTRLQAGDLNTWEPPAAEYDLLVSLDVLSTRGITDDTAVLRRMHRALRPGGTLILNLPAFPFLFRPHDTAVANVRRYRRPALKRTLRELGFTVEYIGYRLPILFFLILAMKTVFFFTHPSGEVSDVRMPPAPINRLFLALHRLENRLLLAGLRLPCGSSLLAVCRRGDD